MKTMEYDNYYSREDVPLHWYSLVELCDTIRMEYPDNIHEQKNAVLKECSKYWPLEVCCPNRKDIALKGGSTRESMKAVYKEYTINLSSNTTCIVKAFKYQKKRWYYWWDLYVNAELFNSGIEIFPWFDSPASYIIFATKPTQSPLLCTEHFRNIRQNN